MPLTAETRFEMPASRQLPKRISCLCDAMEASGSPLVYVAKEMQTRVDPPRADGDGGGGYRGDGRGGGRGGYRGGRDDGPMRSDYGGRDRDRPY